MKLNFVAASFCVSDLGCGRPAAPAARRETRWPATRQSAPVWNGSARRDATASTRAPSLATVLTRGGELRDREDDSRRRSRIADAAVSGAEPDEVWQLVAHIRSL